MPVINVPRGLRERLGDQGADELVELLNRVTEDTKRDVLVLAEERYERRLSEEIAKVNQHTTDVKAELAQQIADVRADLSEQIAGMRVDHNEQITGVRAELSQEIADVRVELSQQIADTRADITRWMFVFWVGQLAALLGILFVFFK